MRIDVYIHFLSEKVAKTLEQYSQLLYPPGNAERLFRP